MTKKTKWIIGIIIGIVVIIFLGALSFYIYCRSVSMLAASKSTQPGSVLGTASHSQKPAEKTIYYCPMHPNYTSDKPGKCPICGMDLVPKAEQAPVEQVRPEMEKMEPGTVIISPERQQLIGVKTEPVKYMNLAKTIRAVGKIEYDEQKQVNVTTKIEGWIEKLYVDYTGKLVEKGQPLFTLYSPELVAAQEEYLLALKSKKELAESTLPESQEATQSLIDSAKKKLQLWDIPAKEIKELERSGVAKKSVTIYSPGTGFVVEKTAVQGIKVMPGDNLFKLVDISSIWLIADVYEYELPFIKLGQTANIGLSNIPGKVFRGNLSYIYPALEEDTRTVKVRIELNNPEYELKPGMYANVEIKVPYGKRLVISDNALIDTGTRQLAIIAGENGHFTPREVKVGVKVENYDEIISGVKSGETVVTNANFLIDSESQMKAALSQMEGMPGMSTETTKSSTPSKPSKSSMPGMPGM